MNSLKNFRTNFKSIFYNFLVCHFFPSCLRAKAVKKPKTHANIWSYKKSQYENYNKLSTKSSILFVCLGSNEKVNETKLSRGPPPKKYWTKCGVKTKKKHHWCIVLLIQERRWQVFSKSYAYGEKQSKRKLDVLTLAMSMICDIGFGMKKEIIGGFLKYM